MISVAVVVDLPSLLCFVDREPPSEGSSNAFGFSSMYQAVQTGGSERIK